MTKRYVVEVRDEDGKLKDEATREAVKKAHPYLFSKESFNIDNLCYYASYGQGRDNPLGPMQLPAFMKSVGATYREKYW